MAFFVKNGRRPKLTDPNGQTPADQRKDDERRYFPRWEVNNRVSYRLNPDRLAHDCRSKDINCCGTCLITDQRLEKDQRLRLTVHLAEGISIQVEGKVLWCKPYDQQYLIGVNFLQTSKQIQDVILEHAFNLRKEDLVRHWFKGWNNR